MRDRKHVRNENRWKDLRYADILIYRMRKNLDLSLWEGVKHKRTCLSEIQTFVVKFVHISYSSKTCTSANFTQGVGYLSTLGCTCVSYSFLIKSGIALAHMKAFFYILDSILMSVTNTRSIAYFKLSYSDLTKWVELQSRPALQFWGNGAEYCKIKIMLL